MQVLCTPFSAECRHPGSTLLPRVKSDGLTPVDPDLTSGHICPVAPDAHSCRKRALVSQAGGAAALKSPLCSVFIQS